MFFHLYKKVSLFFESVQIGCRKLLGCLVSIGMESLKAANDIEVISTDSGRARFRAKSNDPYFLIKKSFFLPLPGWNMLELSIEPFVRPGGQSGLPKVYVNVGNGFNEEDSFSVPLSSGGIEKKLFYLPTGTRSIRLDPIEVNCEFVVSHFKIVWLAPSLAKLRLTKRLSSKHYEYKGLGQHEIIHSLKEKARLQRANWQNIALLEYNKTFSLTGIQGINRGAYTQWIECIEKPKLPGKAETEAILSALEHNPKISILIPVYNTDERLLRECVESVQNQTYPNWELCIADDASSLPHIKPLLNEFAAKDKRIKVVFRDTNGHISEASNSALNLATGEYVALFDHDDLLARHALLRIVQAINKSPNGVFFYTDEDKVDIDGKRYYPHFKPDWNLDLLLSHNYITHFSVCKTSHIRSIGGFRAGVEGSQDYDLILRCTAKLEDQEIIHIPEVLYHWRAIPGSTAMCADEKSYTVAAGMKALKDYFRSQNSEAIVERGSSPNFFKIQWPIPAEDQPLVTLMIPTRDCFAILKQCIDSILEKTAYKNYEILILDNQSSCPETLEYLKRLSSDDKRVRVLKWDASFNYSSINNFGASQAKGSILGLLNNDVEVINAGWLGEMVSHSCREEIGCVGAKLYYPNETLQHGGVILGLNEIVGHSHRHYFRYDSGHSGRLTAVQNLSAVTAACLLVRKSVYFEVGGLNEVDLTVAFNDVDFCLKVREAGYRNLWTPYAELYHHESFSRGLDNESPEKIERANREIAYMKKQWGPILEHDPAYNPNLTLSEEDFSLRWD